MKKTTILSLQVFLFSMIIMAAMITGCTDDNLRIDTDDLSQAGNRQVQWHPSLWQVITPCEAFGLTYFLDPSCNGTAYEDVYHSAMEAYNALDLTIHFTPAANAQEADIVFACVSGTTCAEANASVPFDENLFPGSFGPPNVQTNFDSGGSIGGLINFTIDWEECPCTDEDNCNFLNFEPDCMFKKVVMHEVGHALGLAHNDLDGNLAQHIDGTSTDDFQPGSIFNGGPDAYKECRWCQDCTFTDDDILALESLYGCPDPIVVDIELCAGSLNADQSIAVTSNPSDVASYTVWATYDGIPAKFFVHSHCGTDPLTTEWKVEDVPVGTTVSFFIEQCDTFERVAEFQVTASGYVHTLSINDSYPRLGENVNFTSIATQEMDYQIRLRYELWGQTQYQNVSNVECQNSSSANQTLLNNPNLAYSTVWIEAIRAGEKINEESFTIFP